MPWTKVPSGLLSMGPQRVGHNWATVQCKNAHLAFSSVQFSRSVVSDSLRPHELQHARPPCPSPTARVYSDSRPSSLWCHPAISSSVLFFSCTHSFPASGFFPVNQLFASGGQSIGVSASTSVLPMNTQNWSPLEWTGWISLQPKGLSRVFSNTTVQKHQFFSAQLSLAVQLSHPYMTTGKTIALTRRTLAGKVMSLLLNILSRLVITLLLFSHLKKKEGSPHTCDNVNALAGIMLSNISKTENCKYHMISFTCGI